jgi:hypothetical protein
MVVAACLAPSSAQEKAGEERVKVEVYLSAEHAPEGLKAGARADLVMVLGKTMTKDGKLVSYRIAPLAGGAEVVSVKREEKPANPARAVRAELRVTKQQTARIETAKGRLVTVVESEGGKPVTKKRPVPLRLELVKPMK